MEAEFLKIINDTSLRTRLIESGVAQGLQSPKGPQKIPSIIRLYPNFDAPGKDAVARVPHISEPARTAYGLPSVEDLDALLERIHAAEVIIGEQLQQQVNADIARLKSAIGELDGEEFEQAFEELAQALQTRKALASQIRADAFKHVEADTTFAPRRYLRLISREQ